MFHLQVDESRRLTGPNLLSDMPGACMEIYFNNIEGIDADLVIKLWNKHLQQLIDALGLTAEIYYRHFTGGASLAFTADEDMLYTACEINEAAIELARSEIAGDTHDQQITSMDNLRTLLEEERNPALMELIHLAKEKQVPYLVDDDEFSLGMGPTSRRWAMEQLPDPDLLDWSVFIAIPVALLTGTNGKSTSVRMCGAIAKAASISAGITSTDYIRAADTILDKGDYSGPGGARTLIRDHHVQMALLEVARGGMLRRGLGTTSAKAALITNVADDHLGQYGINTVEELIAVKAIVARSLSEDGTLVVNADDQGLVDYFEKNPQLIRGRICWFSLEKDNRKILQQKQLQEPCVWLEHKQIKYFNQNETINLIHINHIPTSKNGAARHNIANSMAAAALCFSMGVATDAIAEGLCNFKGDNEDNPGRGNYFTINGTTVLVDFAHNPHSLTAIIDTVAAMPAKRRLIMLGHAGDRTDRDILNLTDVAIKLKPDAVIMAEIPDYLRGRELKEIPDIIRKRCLETGFDEEQLIYAESCLAGAKAAIEWSNPGDFVLLLGLDQREEIFQYLASI
ncbi:MAG: Mur ligase [Gammaproteobacteria bacterium]|nr:Mur ligase [Gammaproteobacteria bacterium]